MRVDNTESSKRATRSRRPTSGTAAGDRVVGRAEPGRGNSLSDLEIPVEALLRAEDETRLGLRIQTGFRRIEQLLPLVVEGYGKYLQHMREVTIGERIVAAWFPFRPRLPGDVAAAEKHLQAADKLARGTTGDPARREQRVRRALDRGIAILRCYPLSPEMLFSWARDAVTARSRAGPITQRPYNVKARHALRRALTTVETARDRLVLPNFRLVLKESFRYTPAGMRRSDLFQEGILGLHRAIFRYDPGKGTRFSTYATYWIRQSIRKCLIDRSRLIRIPQAVQEGLRNQDSRLTVEETQRLRRIMHGTVSMSAEAEDDPRDRIAFEATQTGPPAHDETLYLGVIPGEVGRALGKLSSREQEVVRRRFGLGGEPAQTLEEIGDALHLSRERIRQIEREALEKMKREDALQAVYEELN